MQDHSAATSSCLSCQAVGGESVASRLKKMINNVQNGDHSNGSCLNGNSCSNGNTKQEDNVDSNSAVELSAQDKDIIRLLGQHMRGMGMIETVETLIKESGIRLEHPNAAKFRHNVLGGCWEAVLKDLENLQQYLEKPLHYSEMKFLILEQKYLECLEKGRVVDALKVLREELTPLQFNVEKVHALSTYLMLNNSSELKRVAEWEGSSHKARSILMEKLQSFLPASVMLPPRRLETLLSQALEHQRFRCAMHNTFDKVNFGTQTLLTDHSCQTIHFPCETHQILSDHCDEVFFCQFSHNGQFLATGSKDSRVIIWRVEQELDGLKKKLTRVACLEGHTLGASFFVWSPDDTYLLVVGPEDGPDLWIWNMQKYELKVRVTHGQEDSLSTVAWYPDGKRFVCGGSKGQFYACDLEGSIIDTWEGVRIRCLKCKQDGKTVLASDTHHRIRAYSFEDLTDQTILKEEHPLMHFTLSQDDRFALCNVAGQGVHMWDLTNKCLAKRFRGATQVYYSIFSCFGGVNEEYVACGSEDSNIYIWRRDGPNEDPLLVLKGHNGVVNGVSWNPTDPTMLASCSDDGTVRIWGSPLMMHKTPNE